MSQTKASAPETFEIINERFVISPGDAGLGHPAIQGPLASIPGRGRIARWAVRGRDGDENYGYAAVPEDSARQPEVLAAPRDELAAFLSEFDHAHNFRGGGRLLRVEKSAKEVEWERFRQAWPFVAEDLVARQRPVDRLFDPGAIYFHSGGDPDVPPGAIGHDDFRALRDRHVAGDWGMVGTHEPARLDDPAAAWLSGLQDQAFRNSYNIRRGAGVVRSIYPVPGVLNPEKALYVVTGLIPGKEAVTLMLIRHKQQPL